MTTTALQQIDPQGTARRTNDQRALHLDRIKSLLDKGLSKVLITSHICTAFGISRAQAYKDYDYAEAERDAERVDNTPPEENLLGLTARLNMLNEMFVEAYAARDYKAVALLSREIDRNQKMSGRTYGSP